MYPRLDNGMQYRLNEINRLKDYFFLTKFAKKKHSVNILFNYFNKIGYFHKTFIVLSATSSSICFFHEEKDKQSVAKSLFRDLKNKIYNIKKCVY